MGGLFLQPSVQFCTRVRCGAPFRSSGRAVRMRCPSAERSASCQQLPAKTPSSRSQLFLFGASGKGDQAGLAVLSVSTITR